MGWEQIYTLMQWKYFYIYFRHILYFGTEFSLARVLMPREQLGNSRTFCSISFGDKKVKTKYYIPQQDIQYVPSKECVTLYLLLQYRWQTEQEVKDKSCISQCTCHEYWYIFPAIYHLFTSSGEVFWCRVHSRLLPSCASVLCNSVHSLLFHGPETERRYIWVSEFRQQQLINRLLGISCSSITQPDPWVQWFPFLWITEEVFCMKWWSANQNAPTDTNTESSFLLHWIAWCTTGENVSVCLVISWINQGFVHYSLL